MSPRCSKHDRPDPDCFRCKLVSIQFSNVEPPTERLIEQRMEKDLPAYAALRKQGLQPPRTKHAAELATRANSQLEIEMGKLIAPDLLRQHEGQISEGMAMARDAGYTTTDVAGWKKARDGSAA